MMWRFYVYWILSLLLLQDRVAAQDYSIPSSWTNTTTDATQSSVKTLSSGAASALIPLIDPASGSITGFDGLLSASLVIVLSQADYLSNSTTYKTTVETNIQVFGQTHANYFYYSDPRVNSDIIYWGLAAFYAYRAYHDQFLLDLAISLWNTTQPYFITSDEANSFTQPSRNVSIKPRCTSPSVAGGVFYVKDTLDDTSVNGETIGPWLTLSAYLYELTKSPQYLTAAELSTSFVTLQMFNGSYIIDTVDIVSCSKGGGLRSYNTAFFVEGLSVLAQLTQNATQTQLLENFISSIVRFNSWNLLNGVNSENIDGLNTTSSTFKGILLRAFAESRARNPGTPLANLIQTYITVQYNALVANRAGNNYTTSWVGPPTTTFLPEGNLAAIDVFNAVSPFLPPGSTTSPSPSTTSQSQASSKSSTVTAIAAGVAGGIGGALLICAITFFLYRRKIRNKRQQQAKQPIPEKSAAYTDPMAPPHGALVVEPFTAQPATREPPRESILLASGPSGMNSKTNRMNASSGAGMSSGSGSGPSGSRTSEHIDVQQEIPSLLSRLNSLIRISEQQGLFEQPPQYTESHPR